MALRGLSRIRVSVGALCVGLLSMVSCSSSKPADEASVVTAAPTTVASSSTFQNRPAQPCSATTLGAAAEGRYPGVEVLDEACSPETAIATLEGPSVPDSPAVGLYLAGPDGAWLLAMTFADLAALEAGAPPQQVSRALIQSWARRRDQRVNPQPPALQGSTTTESTTPPVSAPQGE